MRLLKKTTKKPIIITVLVLLALVVAGLIWYYALADRDSGDSSTDNSTNSQENSNDSDKKKTVTKQSSEEKPEAAKDQSVKHEKEKELPQLYEGDNVNSSPSLTGAITSKSVQGGNLAIRNTIDQLVGGGTCELTLTSGSKTVTKSAEIIQNPSSSSCAGFDVPVSELGSGQWDIKIKITSEGKETILSDKVNI